MTQNEMNILVPEKLAEIEREHNVTILYAAESGSRAWGFASPDSDFDVRFIYKHPQSEYLKLNEKRDVIELPVNGTWDVSGWKTLRLLHKSNPAIYEWLSSPICYRRTGFAEGIKPLLAEYFSPSRMLYLYLSMARNNIRNHLQAETVKLKRYLYILRPILACLWVMEYNSAPPMRLMDMAGELLPDNLRALVEYLIAEKVKSSEKYEIPHIGIIDSFIESSVSEVKAYVETLHERPKSWVALNEFFRSEIAQ